MAKVELLATYATLDGLVSLLTIYITVEDVTLAEITHLLNPTMNGRINGGLN